ncbi:hypothetical protein DP117_32895 [Brasilonema sp. UFV-L1]|nr:hypothetical protein [Brasilonema sp. UFV-L1]
MLNLTQGFAVRTEHIFLFHKNALSSGDYLHRRYKTCRKLYGSIQRPSILIKLINSSTPFSSGTFLISSLPR